MYTSRISIPERFDRQNYIPENLLSSQEEIIIDMIVYILSIIILVFGISESKYLLVKINQRKNSINISKNSKNGYRQMQIVAGQLPIGISNGIFNGPNTHVPFGPIPNVPIPSPNPRFPHNQYLPLNSGKVYLQ